MSFLLLINVYSITASAYASVELDGSVILSTDANGTYSENGKVGLFATHVNGSDNLYKTDDNQLFSKVNPNLYILVEEIDINPYDLANVEENIDKYHIQEQTAKEIRAYANKCIDENIEGG